MARVEKVHMKVTGERYEGVPAPISWTACGMTGLPSHGATYETEEVTCGRCELTMHYASKQVKKHLDQRKQGDV